LGGEEGHSDFAKFSLNVPTNGSAAKSEPTSPREKTIANVTLRFTISSFCWRFPQANSVSELGEYTSSGEPNVAALILAGKENPLENLDGD